MNKQSILRICVAPPHRTEHGTAVVSSMASVGGKDAALLLLLLLDPHAPFIHTSVELFIHTFTHSFMDAVSSMLRGKGRRDKLYSVQGSMMNTTSGFPITKSFLPFLCSSRRTRETEEGEGDTVGNLRRKWGRKEIECFEGGRKQANEDVQCHVLPVNEFELI